MLVYALGEVRESELFHLVNLAFMAYSSDFFFEQAHTFYSYFLSFSALMPYFTIIASVFCVILAHFYFPSVIIFPGEITSVFFLSCNLGLRCAMIIRI